VLPRGRRQHRAFMHRAFMHGRHACATGTAGTT
jgi:hypothetical protein